MTRPTKINPLSAKNSWFLSSLLYHNLITIYTIATKSSSLLDNLMPTSKLSMLTKIIICYLNGTNSQATSVQVSLTPGTLYNLPNPHLSNNWCDGTKRVKHYFISIVVLCMRASHALCVPFSGQLLYF